jgi:hypothetical protein
MTSVTLAGTTGRLLIDFHPGNGRGANIEIIHSLKLLEGRRSRPPGSWRWPLQARASISYAGPFKSHAFSLPFGKARSLQEHFHTADRKKVKSKSPQGPKFTTKFSLATCHEPTRATPMTLTCGLFIEQQQHLRAYTKVPHGRATPMRQKSTGIQPFSSRTHPGI